MLRVVPPLINRSAYNCIYSIWYLSHRYCCLPLSWKRWNSPTHHQERIELYLQHLVFVTPLLLPAAIVEELELSHPSSGAHTTVSTASGICHTFTAACRYRGRVGILPPIIRRANNCIYSICYLSHRYCYLPLSWKSWNSPSNSSTRAAGISNGVTNSSCCRYSCLRS